MLITTRRDTGWDRIADPIRLDVLDPGPAVELLTNRTRYVGQADGDAAGSIAAELGYLPLALDQAAAYIGQTHISLTEYVRRLREHPADMYAAGGGSAQRTIARVWDITIDAIQARHPAAVTLLHILACYAPDNIPRVILGGSDDPDRLAVDEALGVLASYSMITLTPETVSLHRLVQAVILARQAPENGEAAFGGESPLATALKWLNQAMPADPATNVAGWPLLRALIPHAENVAALFPTDARPETLGTSPQGTRDVSRFPRSVRSGSGVAPSLRWRSTNRLSARTTLPRSPHLADLAQTYWRLGQSAEALPLQQRALQINETALGPDHPDTAVRTGQSGRHLPRSGAGRMRHCPCNSGPCRSPKPPSAQTTPTPPSGWTTWPSPTAIWDSRTRHCRCSSGPCRSPRPPSAPTTPAPPSG